MHPLVAEAIRKAHEMRNRYYVAGYAPGTIFKKIYKDYNIEVRYDQHGADLRKEDDKYIITLPRDTSAKRDAYTIACDIGRIVFGCDLSRGSSLHLPDLSGKDIQPHRFAAEFLMPEDEVRKVCKESGNNVEQVALHFGVSESVAGIWMAFLGIDWS